MINVNDPKVKEIIQRIHESMPRGKNTQSDIVIENRIFSILCADFDIQPSKIARIMNGQYGYNMTGYDVIQIFRNKKISKPRERQILLQWANDVAELFSGAMSGNKEQFEQLEKVCKKSALNEGRKHPCQERITAVMIYVKHPEIDIFEDSCNLCFLGKVLAKYFFYDMLDAIRYVYRFPKYGKEKRRQDKKFSYEQALSRIEQLETILERTNAMLQDLQDEFEEQLKASKVQELTDFFTQLNSEKYGCILDELLVVRKGVDELRKSNYELPIEINGLLIMVKKLIQFVRDSHIEPMMKINSIREVIVSDVEFWNYEGSPFTTPDEKKKVKVVSPGWVYKDKEVQISRPKVKEEN